MTPEAKDALKRIYERSVSGRPSVQVRPLCGGSAGVSLASKAGVCLDLFIRGGVWRA